MTIIVDGKYEAHVRKLVDSARIDSSDVIIFRARDNAVPAALHEYYRRCLALGCSEDHLAAVRQLIVRVDEWRKENPTLCKNPD